LRRSKAGAGRIDRGIVETTNKFDRYLARVPFAWRIAAVWLV